MKKKIYEVLYRYALECKSKAQITEKEKHRSERLLEKKYELTNKIQKFARK